MGHVQDLWYRPKFDPDTRQPVFNERGKPVAERTELYGVGMRYKVRFQDPDDKWKARSFPDKQKKRAEDFLLGIESDKREGKYVDPAAGRKPFELIARKWFEAQTFDYTTRERVESRVETHLIPYFEHKPIGRIKPSDIQGWLRHLQEKHVANNSRVLYFTHLVSIFNFAIADRLIATNPARSKAVTRPREEPTRVQPWPTDRATAVHRAVSHRYKPAIELPVGLGVRQGEAFGFSLDDIDRERNVVVIQRQIRVVGYDLVFALPKGGKTREVPIGAALLDDLDAYARNYPPVPVTLPWVHKDGKPVTVNLLMTNADGTALRRQQFNFKVWRPALEQAGVEPERYENGMHALRHLYASVLLDAGESIKALSKYLGHSDPGFTLRVYTHLLPTSHERTRNAVDSFFANAMNEVDEPPGELAA